MPPGLTRESRYTSTHGYQTENERGTLATLFDSGARRRLGRVVTRTNRGDLYATSEQSADAQQFDALTNPWCTCWLTAPLSMPPSHPQ
jgi:hypothetical protein